MVDPRTVLHFPRFVGTRLLEQLVAQPTSAGLRKNPDGLQADASFRGTEVNRGSRRLCCCCVVYLFRCFELWESGISVADPTGLTVVLIGMGKN